MEKRWSRKTGFCSKVFLKDTLLVVALNIYMAKKRNLHVSSKNFFSSFWVIHYSKMFLYSRTKQFHCKKDMINILFIFFLFCFVKLIDFSLISKTPARAIMHNVEVKLKKFNLTFKSVNCIMECIIFMLNGRKWSV